MSLYNVKCIDEFDNYEALEVRDTEPVKEPQKGQDKQVIKWTSFLEVT